MKISPKRVLVMQPGYVGDVVLVSPVFAALKDGFPDAGLDILVRPDRVALAKSIPWVDRVLIFDKRGRDSGPLGLVRMAVRIKKLGYDVLLSPHRSSRTALLSYLSGVPVRVGFQSGIGRIGYNLCVALDKSQPCRLEQESALLIAMGVEPASTRPTLVPDDDARKYADDFISHRAITSTKAIGLCIGANWATKMWPTGSFAKLASMLINRGLCPILFGGPDEKKIEEQVRSGLPAEQREKVHSSVANDLNQALGLLASCACVVGGDTGLVHMARAVGTPVVMLYGPTDERLHHHYDNERVLVSGVACRPCHRHGKVKCPKRHHRCMKEILPGEVRDAISDVLG